LNTHIHIIIDVPDYLIDYLFILCLAFVAEEYDEFSSMRIPRSADDVGAFDTVETVCASVFSLVLLCVAVVAHDGSVVCTCGIVDSEIGDCVESFLADCADTERVLVGFFFFFLCDTLFCFNPFSLFFVEPASASVSSASCE